MQIKRTKLIELRNAKGWKQKEVAEMLGITDSYYGMIENGLRNPTIKLGLRIAGVFGVSIEEIFFDLETNKMLSDTGTE